MTALVKPFGDHSQRWQREQLRKGIDPKKWDRWRKLSPKSRKATNPYEYAKGTTVRDQLRRPLLDAATRRLLMIHQVRGASRFDGTAIKQAAVRRNLNHPDARVSNAKLRRIASMPAQKLAMEVDDSLARRYGVGERSPFWYEKRG